MLGKINPKLGNEKKIDYVFCRFRFHQKTRVESLKELDLRGFKKLTFPAPILRQGNSIEISVKETSQSFSLELSSQSFNLILSVKENSTVNKTFQSFYLILSVKETS